MKTTLLITTTLLALACKHDDPKPVVDEKALPTITYLKYEAEKDGVTLNTSTISIVFFSDKINNPDDNTYVEGKTIHVDNDYSSGNGFADNLYLSKLILKLIYPSNTCIDKYKVNPNMTQANDDTWDLVIDNVFTGSDCPL